MLRALETPTNLIDRHFLLLNIIEQTYRLRSDPTMAAECARVAEMHLAEFERIAPALKSEFDGTLPHVPTFERYATLLTEQGDFDLAVWVCELAHDQFGNDQILVLAYQDENGRRSYGLRLHDRPGTFPVDVLKLTSMPEGPEKDRLLRELIDSGAFGFVRMFLGRNSEGHPTIALNDSKGRQRLRLSVDSADIPRIEVLDERGRVAHTLPSASNIDRMAELERQVLELRQEVQKLKDRARA